MARQNTLRQILVRIHQAVRDLAAVNGWQTEDYQLYVRIHEGTIVSSIHVLIEARAFPGADDQEKWERVLDFLERKLKDLPELRGVMHLVIRTFDESADEGSRLIRESYFPIEELIASVPAI